MFDNATNYISNKDIVLQQLFRHSVLLFFVIIWKLIIQLQDTSAMIYNWRRFDISSDSQKSCH